MFQFTPFLGLRTGLAFRVDTKFKLLLCKYFTQILIIAGLSARKALFSKVPLRVTADSNHIDGHGSFVDPGECLAIFDKCW